MNQTFLTLAALGCIVAYSAQSRRASHHQDLGALRAQVEFHAAEVAAGLLDRAATLPFDAPTPGPAPTFAAAVALDQWHGHAESVGVAAGGDTLRYAVRATVVPVEKTAGGFAVASAGAPFRRVTLVLDGDLDVSATIARVYADLDR